MDRLDIDRLGYVAIPPELQPGALGNQILIQMEGEIAHIYFWQFVTDADPTGEWPDGQAGVVTAHIYVPWETLQRMPRNLTEMVDHFHSIRPDRDQSP